jgi:type I restriction enzyme S subunit
MSEWQVFKLDEIGTLQRGRSRHRPRYAFHLYGGKYPFIQTGDVREARKYIKNYEQTYSEAGLEQSKLWPKGTLCITIAANIAELAILSFDACFPDSVLGFNPNKDKADLNFVYYTLTFFQRELKHIGEGSVQDNINLGTFQDVSFPIPPLPEQKAIAAVLSSLDDKIDLLHRQNLTLEAMAETLFRQWFIEEAQEDWEEVLITDLFEVRDGTHDSPKQTTIGKPLITSKHILDGRLDIENAYLISEDDFEKVNQRSKVDTLDILFSMIGTIGLTYMEQSQNIDYAIKNIGLFKTSQNQDWATYTYLWLKSSIGQQFVDEHKSGSTQEYVSLGSLRSITFLKPPADRLIEFNRVTSSYFAKLYLNRKQILTLEKLRNTLLPKLMSGEVRVAV